ncbi:MAG TPA: radical SAM protein [Spirochaetia bacterium]|nr:radical SAM protein [Spirochaetia bacterium]
MGIKTSASAARLNQGIRIFFSEFVRVSLRRPAQAAFFARTVLWQGAAARRRARAAREGLHVPPIAIFSITNRCNLRCKGCYAQAIRGDAPEELSADSLRSIVSQAEEVGVSFFVIAGGEPLVRPEIVDIARDFRRVVFLLVTNGLLLGSELISRLKEQPNTVPVLSIEGNEADTDGRRGAGVHQRLRQRMEELKAAGIFFSLSFTITRNNFETVTEPGFIESAIREGCRLFLFLEYTPIREGTEDWVITDSQRDQMKELVASFRSRYKAVFIAVPWDEEEQGGCLASGRGFVHISATGDLEPCPFAPYSDVSLKRMSLKEALRSRFLAVMREKHDLFAETSTGCALWNNRDQVRALLEEKTG